MHKRFRHPLPDGYRPMQDVQVCNHGWVRRSPLSDSCGADHNVPKVTQPTSAMGHMAEWCGMRSCPHCWPLLQGVLSPHPTKAAAVVESPEYKYVWLLV